jgi:hypothetical protein
LEVIGRPELGIGYGLSAQHHDQVLAEAGHLLARRIAEHKDIVDIDRAVLVDGWRVAVVSSHSWRHDQKGQGGSHSEQHAFELWPHGFGAPFKSVHAHNGCIPG